jgi:hypothetical protein
LTYLAACGGELVDGDLVALPVGCRGLRAGARGQVLMADVTEDEATVHFPGQARQRSALLRVPRRWLQWRGHAPVPTGIT